jgi:hypothetical protein
VLCPSKESHQPTLVVYDSANRVSEIYIDSNSTSHSSKLLFTVDGDEIPVGMALGLYRKQAYLFILTKSANGKHGTIQVFTYPQGKPTGGKLPLDDVATGLDYDETAGALYYVTSSNGRLFRFVQCTGKIESIGSIPGLGRAGPVAVLPGPRVDPCRGIQSSRSRLYVGDVVQGGLFEYDLRSKNIDKISKYIGSVSSASTPRKSGKPNALSCRCESSRDYPVLDPNGWQSGRTPSSRRGRTDHTVFDRGHEFFQCSLGYRPTLDYSLFCKLATLVPNRSQEKFCVERQPLATTRTYGRLRLSGTNLGASATSGAERPICHYPPVFQCVPFPEVAHPTRTPPEPQGVAFSPQCVVPPRFLDPFRDPQVH